MIIEWTKGKPKDAKPVAGGQGGGGRGGGEAGCACTAKITDYSLQVNAYVGKDVVPGPPQALIEAHEMTHVREKRKNWLAHKAELDTLLDRQARVPVRRRQGASHRASGRADVVPEHLFRRG